MDTITLEMQRLLVNPPGAGLIIEQRLVPIFPGYVRTVYLRADNRVVVEYEQYGFDEAGAYFYGEYCDLASLVREMEAFLRKPVSEWKLLSERNDYPVLTKKLDTPNGTKRLLDAIRDGTVPLPGGT
ncbi:MAG TPA: hypothetical protein VFE47_23340 [Tepidisphaeraceae bacterium]|jgi:hypothetical protein|nr:hypothetical protein [Tepidisphaeraceae bacterium]